MTVCAEKQCARCKEVKSTSFFSAVKARKDGFHRLCKECNKIDCNERYQRYKPRYRASAIEKKYGKGALAFYESEIAKDDKCRVCGISESEAPKGRLAIDHCHGTGRLRGLLCDKCNTAIGLMQDDISHLTAAIEYLRNNS